MLSFISNLVGVKADKAVQAGVEALVRWDPEGASEAELRTMEQHLDDLGRQVAMARQAYDKERRKATRHAARPWNAASRRWSQCSRGWRRRSIARSRTRPTPRNSSKCSKAP